MGETIIDIFSTPGERGGGGLEAGGWMIFMCLADRICQQGVGVQEYFPRGDPSCTPSFGGGDWMVYVQGNYQQGGCGMEF